MKKNIYLAMALAFGAFCAEAESLTVTHSTAGAFDDELSAALTDASLQASAVTELKVVSATGADDAPVVLQAADYDPIRTTLTALVSLDLSEAVMDKNMLASTDVQGLVGPFYKMETLESVVLPEGLTTIGGGAFNACAKLKSVTIPSTVTTINKHAFRDCKVLELTALPASLKTINEYAFFNCQKLALTEFPDGITQILGYAFKNCSSLAASNLPASINTIGKEAFYNCPKYVASELPEGLENIGYAAFRKSGVSFSTWPSTLTKVDTSASGGTSNSDVFGETKVTFTSWPDNLEYIPNGLFVLTETITNFEIPARMTNLMARIFFISKAVDRTFTYRGEEPPTCAIDKTQDDTKPGSSGTFGVLAAVQATHMRVLHSAIESFRATEPYKSMILEELTLSAQVVLPEGEGWQIASELGEPSEGILNVYEGANTLTVTVPEGKELDKVYLTYMLDGAPVTETLYDSAVVPAVYEAAGSAGTSVAAIMPQNATSVRIEVMEKTTQIPTGIDSVGEGPDSIRRSGDWLEADADMTLYNCAGAVVGRGCRIDLSKLPAGVYVARTSSATLKVLK